MRCIWSRNTYISIVHRNVKNVTRGMFCIAHAGRWWELFYATIYNVAMKPKVSLFMGNAKHAPSNILYKYFTGIWPQASDTVLLVNIKPTCTKYTITGTCADVSMTDFDMWVAGTCDLAATQSYCPNHHLLCILVMKINRFFYSEWKCVSHAIVIIIRVVHSFIPKDWWPWVLQMLMYSSKCDVQSRSADCCKSNDNLAFHVRWHRSTWNYNYLVRHKSVI